MQIYYSLNPSLSSLRFNIYCGKRSIKIKKTELINIEEVTELKRLHKRAEILISYILYYYLCFEKYFILWILFFDFSVLQTYKSLEMYSYFLKKKEFER